jgi:hypothetical protein
MKTPEQALAEYASDLINCFHGHKETWRDFETCCEAIRTEKFGIYPCFWEILKAKGFSQKKVQALKAAICLIKDEDLGPMVFKYGHELSERIKTKYASFFYPYRLLLYETREEVERSLPSIEEDILEVAPDDHPFSVAETSYQRFLSSRFIRMWPRVQSNETVKDVWIELDRNGVKETYQIAMPVLREYLSILGGLRIHKVFIEMSKVTAFNEAPAKIKVELDDGRRGVFLLYSPVTFEYHSI